MSRLPPLIPFDAVAELPAIARSLAKTRKTSGNYLPDRPVGTQGFVRRVRDPVDRRRVLVEMTEEGRSQVAEYCGPIFEEGSALFGDITDKQLEQMRDWLARPVS